MRFSETFLRLVPGQRARPLAEEPLRYSALEKKERPFWALFLMRNELP